MLVRKQFAIALIAFTIVCFQSIPTNASPQMGLTTNTSHYVGITITNTQSSPTPATYQQMLAINSSAYASYEAPNLQNVEFFGQNGIIIPSWLESGKTRLSTGSIYWLRITSAIPAHSSTTIFMEFVYPEINVFNSATTGEAPTLSPAYGEYDNGANVFDQYTNFAGSSIPAEWYSETSGSGIGSVSVSDGIRLTHSGTGGGYSAIGSNWTLSNAVTEEYLTGESTNNGQDMVIASSNSPASFSWQPGQVGYQNAAGLELENNNGGTPSVLSVANPDPSLPAVIGVFNNNLYANYQTVAVENTNILPSGYLASSANTGFNASFAFSWVRQRTAPPSNMMPTALLEGTVQRVGNTPTVVESLDLRLLVVLTVLSVTTLTLSLLLFRQRRGRAPAIKNALSHGSWKVDTKSSERAGSDLAFCPKCNSQAMPNHAYCGNCGSKIA